MMKKPITAALLMGAVLVTPAMAQEEQHQHGAAQGGSMMSHGAEMQAHRKAMHDMDGVLHRAMAASDPTERKRLMAEHSAMMQAQMAKMMAGENAKMMQQHHERMAMMHEMMAQMAAHYAAEHEAGPED